MSLPRGIKIRNRIGAHPDKPGHLIVCQRRGHGPFQEYIPGTRRDAESVLSAHDTAYHNQMLRAAGMRPLARITVHDLADEYVTHRESLEIEGKSEPGTTEHYRYMRDVLKKGFSKRDRAAELTPSIISAAIIAMRQNTNSAGAAIVKALHALRKMLRWKGIPVDWSIPHDEIQPERFPKRELSPDEITRFVKALPRGSVERAVVLVKLLTVMRNEEIFALRARDVDLEEGVVRFVLRSKRGEKKTQAFPLIHDAWSELRPWVEGKGPDERVFTIHGRRLQKGSLRKRFLKASEAAELEPPVEFIGTLRNESITAASEILGVEPVSKAIGHRNLKTTERYLRYRENVEKKRVVAEAIATSLLGNALGNAPA